MKVSRTIKELKKYNPMANIRMHGITGNALLCIRGVIDDDKIVVLKSSSNNTENCMKVFEAIEELEKYNTDADVKMYDRKGEPLLFVLGITGYDETIFLESESDNDMGNELNERFEHALETQMDELDFYMDLLEIGVDVSMVRKYMGNDYAEHMQLFCEEHGLN